MTPENAPSLSWVEKLEAEHGADWPALRKARGETALQRARVERALSDKVAPDTSLVLFGSIARGEMTSKSDSDWILLVDGQAQPQHADQTIAIGAALKDLGLPEPGRSGVFGGRVGSHDLVHEIGGEDDTNSNTTRRVLLLLESIPIGKVEAYDRVRRQILDRYLKDDRGLTRSTGHVRVPRFLLNDLTRYWRTITVDFVYKQRADAGKKWALRNAKLRMSRKLVFASGLLRCFFCHLDPAAAQAREDLVQSDPDLTRMAVYLEEQLGFTALDVLAQAASRPTIQTQTRLNLFDSYNQFLALLDDQEKRTELETLTEAQMATSAVWKEVRSMSHRFQSGLRQLFFEDDPDLARLTIDYGVF